MSDTPRTDEAQFGTGRVSVGFARYLERELNAANVEIERLKSELSQSEQLLFESIGRIMRLVGAGDAIVDHIIVSCGCGHDGPCRACRMACEAWEASKEAKL